MKTKRFVTILILALTLSFASAQTADPHGDSGSYITGIPSEKIWMVLDITVQDSLQYQKYREAVEPLIEKYGGKYKVRSGGMAYDPDPDRMIIPVEGNWNPNRFIITEWESMEQLQIFSASEEYKAVAKLRENAAFTKSIIVKNQH